VRKSEPASAALSGRLFAVLEQPLDNGETCWIAKAAKMVEQVDLHGSFAILLLTYGEV